MTFLSLMTRRRRRIVDGGQDLIGALRKNDPAIRVGDVMRRDIPTVTTGTRFEDAFRIMQEWQLSGGASPRSDEAPGRFAHAGERDRIMMVQSADAARDGSCKCNGRRAEDCPPYQCVCFVGRARHSVRAACLDLTSLLPTS